MATFFKVLVNKVNDFSYFTMLIFNTPLLHFLPLALLVSRLTPQPNTHKGHPPGNCNPYTSNPDPASTDLPAAWPFVVSKMSDRYFPLDIHVGKERPLVVDAK